MKGAAEVLRAAGERVAALYVETGGCYFGLPGVDPWDEARDARLYRGPHSVVAHPPCQRWGKYWAGSPLVIARTGQRLRKGDDNGCFAAALTAVRHFGGVLEHPEGSHAWTWFGLNKPPRTGGWVAADWLGGWTCCVEQGAYGHVARKATWLYACRTDLPTLRWGRAPGKFERLEDGFHSTAARAAARAAGWTRNGPRPIDRLRLATPEPFRDVLLAMARSVSRERIAA